MAQYVIPRTLISVSSHPDLCKVLFGKPSQFCLDTRDCYCKTYGYCDMSDSDLERQWVWIGLQLPKGWPNPDPMLIPR